VSTARIIALLLAIGCWGCTRASSGTGSLSAAKLPVSPGDYPAFGHAPDFSWVSGRLIRSAPAGECTYVMFSAHPGEPWGGRIALVSSADDIALFPNRDMVVVTGKLDSRALSACGEPAISVKTIEEH
jgi:hypothetical protein